MSQHFKTLDAARKEIVHCCSEAKSKITRARMLSIDHPCLTRMEESVIEDAHELLTGLLERLKQARVAGD